MASSNSSQPTTVGTFFTLDNTPYQEKYQNRQTLDAKQNDQNTFKYINALQDYSVIIRKKRYYVARADQGGYEDDYIEVFQVNNFMSASTSITTTSQSPGTMSVRIRGGEKVIVSRKQSNGQSGDGYSALDSLFSGWNNIDTSKNGNLDYNQILATSFNRDGTTWYYAEKCDWEPMDEIYLFSKNLNLLNGGKQSNSTAPEFKMLFFGYINSVTRSYASESGGLTIDIQASDQLKLLQISYVAQQPAADMSVGGATASYDRFGNMIIDDNYTANSAQAITGLFAGQYPNEVVKINCQLAGIPDKFINGPDGKSGRIEAIERIPFLPNMQQTNNFGGLFNSQFQNRLVFCQQAAEYCNLEFFADEEGNIVLKIPTFTVGINRLPANNLGYDSGIYYEPQDPYHSNPTPPPSSAPTKPAPSTQPTQPQFLTYTVKKGDTLWDIAGKLLGNPTLWRTYIYNYNTNIIKNPHWIYPGQVLKVLNPKYKPNSPSSAHKSSVPSKVSNTPPATPKQPSAPTLAAQNDLKIPVIPPELIVSFSMQDSDSGVFTMVQVTTEQISNYTSGAPAPATTRTVADYNLIAQFGLRPTQNNTTIVAADGVALEIYAALLLLRSLMQRITGSLTMIETPEIQVGQPIRFHMYDEMPFPNPTSDPDPSSPNQAVFYVASISRNISIGSVSTMTLALQAGRTMGMPSIYDQAQEIYRYFYDDGTGNSNVPSNTKLGTSSSGSSSNSGNPGTSTNEPLLKEGMSGSAVKNLQQLLNKHGARLTVDGAFGPLTEQAVIVFQRTNHLTVDGIVGPQTWAALNGTSSHSTSAPPPPTTKTDSATTVSSGIQKSSSSSKYIRYTVQAGETLYGIAQKFYSGNGSMWKQIALDNNIKSANMIYKGMILNIYGYTSGQTYATAQYYPSSNSNSVTVISGGHKVIMSAD